VRLVAVMAFRLRRVMITVNCGRLGPEAVDLIVSPPHAFGGANRSAS
jgi:hypothetical protein